MNSQFLNETSEIFGLVVGASIIVKIVLLVLIGFSIISWSIILAKSRLIRRAKKESNKFLDIFWNSRKLDVIYETTKKLITCPLAEVFKAGYVELVNLKSAPIKTKQEQVFSTDLGGIENVRRALERTITEEITHLEKTIPFLATTGSTAPFIGLFGTVWGIMESFIHIGATKDTSLAVVAPGISEALIATAMGLLAAIPAVVSYNIFVNKIKVLTSQMETFSNDFLNIVKRHFFQ